MRHRHVAPLALLVALLVTAACGTRLSDDAFADNGAGTGANDGDGVTDTPTVDSTPEVPNEASDVGVTEDTIRLGNITAENGILGDTFAPGVRGLRAWVEATNADGGIHGREVELFTCDDAENRAESLECARELVEGDEVFALVATNSRALGGASQYLADNDVPVMGFPITNAFYRYPEFFTVYGTGYERDGDTVGFDGSIVSLSGQYRWFAENLGVTEAAVFYYDIAESAQNADTHVAGLEAEGFDVTRYPVSFGATNYDQEVADMADRGVEIIFDAVDDGANRRLCDSIARRDFEPVAKVSTVVIMGETTGANYNESCRNVMFVPSESRPYTSGEPEIVEFRDAFAEHQPEHPLHQWALDAWATANIAAEAIESMGPSPTRDGFVEYLDTMDANTGGDVLVGTRYRSGEYDGEAATREDCFAVNRWSDDDEGWVMASDPFPFCYPDAIAFAAPATEQGN